MKASTVERFLVALRDPKLLGAMPCFKDLSSWRGWIAIFRAWAALPLDPWETEWILAHTGRPTLLQRFLKLLLLICARQVGKTRMATTFAAFVGATAPPSARGKHVVLIAQDQRASTRVAFGYVCEVFDTVPAFRDLVVRRTSDTLELKNGVCISVYPCRPAALRGLVAIMVIVDEAAWFTSTDGRPLDLETIRAAWPCLATTGGPLLVLTSPYAQSGWAWDTFGKNFGKPDPTAFVVQSSALDLNPGLPSDYIARMERDDPEAYRSEVLGEFRAGLCARCSIPKRSRRASSRGAANFRRRRRVPIAASLIRPAGALIRSRAPLGIVPAT